MNKLLLNRNAVVTGAGAGIGKAIALALAAEGANVAICDISLETAEKTAEEIKNLGVTAKAYYSDISKIEDHKALIEKIENEMGQIDILVNNAGISFAVPVLEVTPQMWDLVHSINLRGTFFLTQVVFEKMMERKAGKIISIASISGVRPADRADAAYCTSKAGVVMMTKVFAKAARDTAINVNSISPGVIETELTVRMNQVINSEKIPMGRMGLPEEVADTAVYLASDLSKYVTGQNIQVNGGQYML